MRNEAHDSRPYTNQTVIHFWKMKRVRIWNITGNVKRNYLPITVAGSFFPRYKAVENETAIQRFRALLNYDFA
jgi:hypothetical protein